MKTEQQWKVTIGSQEECVIPQHLASLAQFENGDALEVVVQPGRIIIAERQSLRAWIDQFIMETREELGALKSGDMWNDEMTVEEYLALSEEERDQLWEAAFAQAHSEGKRAKEIDADADYVPAGQRSC